MNRQTTHLKKENVKADWLEVDAQDQVLGRLASRIAMVLMGKHKPTYTPHCDTGDFVVVTNAQRVKLTGRKADQKFRETYTGHPSGRKLTSYRDLIREKPELLIEDAVRRMLPKNRLGRQMHRKLKVYRGPDHPHAAQQPKPFDNAAA